MLDALRAPPVPPGRDTQDSEDLFMDLDEPPSKRPRDTPSSSTQQFDCANPDEFVQRARNVSVPLPRTPEQPVTPFQPVPHGNVAPETPQLSVPSTPPFQCFPGGETAPVTPRVENPKLAQLAPSFSVPVSRPMPSTFAVPSTLPADSVVTTEVPSTLLPDPVVAPSHADPVVAHDHAPTQFDEESAVDTQFDDPFQFDDLPVCMTIVTICRTTSEHSFRVEFASLLRILNPMRNVCAWMLANGQFWCCLAMFHPVQSVARLWRSSNPVKTLDAQMSSSLVELRTRKCSTKHSWSRSKNVWTLRWFAHGTSGTNSESRSSCPNDIMKRNPDQKIVGTRWVCTEKTIQGKPDYKARLVVQGCQEGKGYIRTDAPTGSRDAFFMTLSAASQSGWDCIVLDAQSAYLQSDGIERLLLLRMLHKNPPPCVVRAQQESVRGSWFCGVKAGTRSLLLAWTIWTRGSRAHTCRWLSVCVQESLQEIQGCFATSCAQASFETTVRFGCVLRKNHLQWWQ